MYRVAHLVADKLLLTMKLELRSSIRSLYCSGTFNLMSRKARPPCTEQQNNKKHVEISIDLWATRSHFNSSAAAFASEKAAS